MFVLTSSRIRFFFGCLVFVFVAVKTFRTVIRLLSSPLIIIEADKEIYVHNAFSENKEYTSVAEKVRRC